MENFDIKKFLTENRITETSKLLSEYRGEKSGDYEITAKDGYVVVTYKGRTIGDGDYDSGARSFFMSFPSDSKKGQHSFNDFKDIFDYVKKNNITEQVELNEASKFLKGLDSVDDIAEAIRDMMRWMEQNDYMKRHGRVSPLYKRLKEAYRDAREYYM